MIIMHDEMESGSHSGFLMVDEVFVESYRCGPMRQALTLLVPNDYNTTHTGITVSTV